ncbi:hypothetical protein [Falsiroseomonas sp. E2-1-a4]|uniref:hypothetical protein n=1 Tax=Falsiroseomonas sp. E2-1-a4 TaxID=3239299 RepID=UPI003F33D8E9
MNMRDSQLDNGGKLDQPQRTELTNPPGRTPRHGVSQAPHQPVFIDTLLGRTARSVGGSKQTLSGRTQKCAIANPAYIFCNLLAQHCRQAGAGSAPGTRRPGRAGKHLPEQAHQSKRAMIGLAEIKAGAAQNLRGGHGNRKGNFPGSIRRMPQ